MKRRHLFAWISLAAAAAVVPFASPALAACAPNELGRVPVLEYHRLAPKEGSWTRSFEAFRKDLEWLYANDYVAVTAAQYAAGELDVPAGKKPVVLTFDDATEVQFRFQHAANGAIARDRAGKPLIDPDCAVGLLDAFAASHPGFGRAATFYVLPNAFAVTSEAGLKLQYLLDTGREIGNHTYSHAKLKKLSPDQIRTEMVKAQDEVARELGKPFRFATFALPNGIYPKDQAGVQAVVEGGNGEHRYRHSAVMLVGADPAPSPFDKKFNLLKVPRIQGIDSEWKRHFNRNPLETGRGSEAFKPYVSDGDPRTVSFPAKLSERLNSAALGSRQARPLAQTTMVPVRGGGGPAAAEASASLRAHPGYANAPLPAGGEYVNGRIFHTMQQGQTPTQLANAYLWMTDYYTRRSLERDLLSRNGFSGWIPVGKRFEIPGVRAQSVVPKRLGNSKTFVARGLYVTKTSAGTERVFTLVNQMKPYGLNTVVFDVKDMDGVLAYDSKVPLAVESGSARQAIIRDLPKLVDRLHAQGIHVVARQALFHDDYLAQHRPKLALRSRSGGPWREKGKLVWVDPNHPEVRAYNLGITQELVDAGVDEVQYDYIRFPAMGALKDIAYSFDPAKTPKHTVITSFLKAAYEKLHPQGVLLSLDVFGVVAWDEALDVQHTGQRLEDLGKYADVISPMVYPSHFYPPFLGHKYPADEPYYFVSEGVKRTAKKTASTGIVIRPWLQAFRFMVRHYGPDYVAIQIKAASESKAVGYLLWNAGNDYDIGLKGVEGVSRLKAALAPPAAD